MTASCHLFGSPTEAAAHIKTRIRDELGFTVNIGISNNKLLAKMASDFKKPDKVHTLYPEEIKQKMWPLPVSDLFFVGSATSKKLFSLGVHTIGELAGMEPSILKSIFKKQGEVIWSFANGIDFSVVQAQAPVNKGYGNSTTTPYHVLDTITAKMVLLALSETVAGRLRADSVQVQVVTVGIKGSDWYEGNFSFASHQKTLQTATNITAEIYDASCELFEELWDGRPLRHLAIHTERVHGSTNIRQIGLFDEVDYDKLIKVDKAVDTIRNQFGLDSVMRAAFLKQPIDHMCGGISREKRNVDYSKIRID